MKRVANRRAIFVAIIIVLTIIIIGLLLFSEYFNRSDSNTQREIVTSINNHLPQNGQLSTESAHELFLIIGIVLVSIEALAIIVTQALRIIKRTSPQSPIVLKHHNGETTFEQYLLKRRSEWRNQSDTFIPLELQDMTQAGVIDSQDYVTENLSNMLARHNQRLVLLGEPGSGKSTLLRNEFIERAKVFDRNSIGDNSILPFWIDLGRSDNEIEFEPLLEQWWARSDLESSPQVFLEHKNLILLLDGLNELPGDKTEQWERIRAIAGFLTEHDEIPVIITCRSTDYREDWKLGLEIVEIQAMDQTRIELFIDGYLGEENMLWSRIDNTRELMELARNPYSLSMLTRVYQKAPDGRLPEDLFELYGEYIKTKYEATKHLLRTNWGRFNNGLQNLAFWQVMHLKGTLVNERWARRQSGRGVFQDALELGILVREDGAQRFYHESLLNFYASPNLAKRINKYKTIRFIVTEANHWSTYLFLYGVISLSLLFLLQWSGYLSMFVAFSATGVLFLLWRWMRGLGRVRTFRFYTFIAEGQIRRILLMQGSVKDVDLLIEMSADEDSTTRSLAVKGLGKIGGEQATQTLIGIISNSKEVTSIIEDAAKALAMTGDQSATPALNHALQHKDPSVRKSAIEALGVIGGTKAIQTLASVLQDDNNQEVRRCAAKVLEKAGDRSLQPILIESLKSRDPEVRDSAADALGNFGDSSAVPALIDALDDENGAVRTSVSLAIFKLADTATINELMSKFNDIVLQNKSISVKENEDIPIESIPELIESLGSEDTQVRMYAMNRLQRLGGESISALIKALGHKNNVISGHASIVLSRFGADAIPSLVEALHQDDKQTRTQAGITLRNIGADSIPYLIELLADPKKGTRLQASVSLADIGGEAVPKLIEALKISDEQFNLHVFLTLEAIGKEAVPGLTGLLYSEDETIRSLALYTIREIDAKENHR